MPGLSGATPWQCPECRTWVAPHVTEHRCDPPAAMVSVTSIDPPGSGSGFVATVVPVGTTITYNVTGSVISGRDLLDQARRAERYAANLNWSGGWAHPGRAV